MNYISACILLVFTLITNVNATNNGAMYVNTEKNTFVIKLAANATTGFQWQAVDFDKNLFNLNNSHYEKSPGNLAGAGGKMIFTFSLKAGKIYPESTQMVFKYSRSWEPKSATLKYIRVNFVKN